MARGDNIQGRGTGGGAQMMRDFERVKESLENLAAKRGEPTKPLSAIRRGELRALASLRLQSSQVTGSPSMDDYNALQADVAVIFETLKRISNLSGTATVQAV